MELKFNNDGLIPAIIIDYYTKDVLMLAYMNRESLDISIKERKTCFYSRSRQQLWRKGETSGNFQHIVSITADCDKDTLLISVIKDGPACHTGMETCFFDTIAEYDYPERFSADTLYSVIMDRKENKKEGSYTTYLFDKGTDKILKKVGEECTEVIIAGATDDRESTVYEIADLYYHVMVLMADKGITPDEIGQELVKRHVVDKKVKQERLK